jgi:hypothetical protein
MREVNTMLNHSFKDQCKARRNEHVRSWSSLSRQSIGLHWKQCRIPTSPSFKRYTDGCWMVVGKSNKSL